MSQYRNGVDHLERLTKPITKTVLDIPADDTPPIDPYDETAAKFDVPVVAMAYYPVDSQDRLLEPNVDTGYFEGMRGLVAPGAPSGSYLTLMKSFVNRQIQMGLNFGQEASKFRGYSDPSAVPSVRHRLHSFFEYNEPLPFVNDVLPDRQNLVDLNRMLNRVSICNLVENQGVQQVWIFKMNTRAGYHAPEFYTTGPHTPHAQMMGWLREAAPKCAKTYNILVHDFPRWDLLLHIWYHAFEFKMRQVDADRWHQWQGPCLGENNWSCYPGANPAAPRVARCGNCHNGPNARSEYDITNPAAVPSDCEDFNPDGQGGHGQLKQISCSAWNCSGNGNIESNETVNYTTWNLQNMPGFGNTITQGGKRLRNWWDAYADFDGIKSRGENLTAPPGYDFGDGQVNPLPSPPPPTGTLTLSDLRLTNVQDGQQIQFGNTFRFETNGAQIPTLRDVYLVIGTSRVAHATAVPFDLSYRPRSLGKRRVFLKATDINGNTFVTPYIYIQLVR